jgi:hypothetical protein
VYLISDKSKNVIKKSAYWAAGLLGRVVGELRGQGLEQHQGHSHQDHQIQVHVGFLKVLYFLWNISWPPAQFLYPPPIPSSCQYQQSPPPSYATQPPPSGGYVQSNLSHHTPTLQRQTIPPPPAQQSYPLPPSPPSPTHSPLPTLKPRPPPLMDLIIPSTSKTKNT